MGDDKVTRLVRDQREVMVERALSELRSGRPVILNSDDKQHLVMAAEAVDDGILNELAVIGASKPVLVLSQPRLRFLGRDTGDAGIVPLDGVDAAEIQKLVVKVDAQLNGHVPKQTSELERTALDLVRLALLLPAAVLVPLPRENFDASLFIPVDGSALDHYRKTVHNKPRIVARAPVPLDGVGESEFVVFRGGEGMRDQVAVVIGTPEPGQPVYARLHSACLTGDLFASLKCDCGDQLRGSATFMAENGGGVILYLDQEGRGNGIANKIRAYSLQYAGYSTYDADEILGFGLDQRGFQFAADMFKQLGFTSIKLLTNNPLKVNALKEAGLDVVSSHRAKARLNLHNVAYLTAKRDRAGHLIEDDLD